MANDARTVAALFLEQARDLWPFYLGAVLFAAFIKTFKWDRRIRASLVRREGTAILVAVGAGLVSPLCSCGILPVVIALSSAGVPLPPVFALLITSPLMSPDAFLITAGQLGTVYALWKLGAAAATGLAAGYLALWLCRRGLLPQRSFRAEEVVDGKGEARPGYEEIVAAGCFSHASAPPSPGGGPSRLRRALGGEVAERGSRILFFLERARDMALVVGKFLVPALLVQAAVTYYIPANAIEPLLGRKSALSVLFGALISIPLPLNQVAAPSLVKGLLAAGMGPGAAMAILVGGPVTSLPALTVMAGAYDRRAFALYLSLGVAAALASGFLFQAVNG